MKTKELREEIIEILKSEWQKAAARWRDNYFEAMDEAGLIPTSEVIDEVIENEENNCKCGGIKLPESNFCKECI